MITLTVLIIHQTLIGQPITTAQIAYATPGECEAAVRAAVLPEGADARCEAFTIFDTSPVPRTRPEVPK